MHLSARKATHLNVSEIIVIRLIHYAVVELRTRRSLSAWMQVGDERFNEDEINRLYDEGDFPLRKSK
jgi:hypothetical protein